MGAGGGDPSARDGPWRSGACGWVSYVQEAVSCEQVARCTARGCLQQGQRCVTVWKSSVAVADGATVVLACDVPAASRLPGYRATTVAPLKHCQPSARNKATQVQAGEVVSTTLVQQQTRGVTTTFVQEQYRQHWHLSRSARSTDKLHRSILNSSLNELLPLCGFVHLPFFPGVVLSSLFTSTAHLTARTQPAPLSPHQKTDT